MQYLTANGYDQDDWIRVGDDEPMPRADVIMPFARWLAENPIAHAGRIGVILSADPGAAFETIDFEQFAIIGVDFSPFTDGRGYSLARLLRQRGYHGDLRAFGEIQRDQLFFLARCGYSSFEVGSRAQALEIAKGFTAYSHVYQPSADSSPTIRERRRAAAGAK